MSTSKHASEKPVVVITGSDGLIGSALMPALHRDFDLVGLDNDRSAENDELYDLIYCDLTDEESTNEAFAQLLNRHGDRIASFIHMAAYYDFSGEDSPLYEELTVRGTQRILRHLQSFEVEQFVFASTMLIMKPSVDGEPLTESSPLQAEWAYPQSKLETEELIERERGDIPVVLLRIAGVYTEWGRAAPIAQQMKRIYEKELESYLFPGDDSHGQSMVHLEDLVSCFQRVIEKRGELGAMERFLIGEPEAMSYEELQDEIGRLLHGEEWPSLRIPKSVAKMGARVKQRFEDDDGFIKPWMVDLADQDYRISIDKARRLLGWEPRHKLRNHLPRIAGNLLHHTEKWYRVNGMKAPERQEVS